MMAYDSSPVHVSGTDRFSGVDPSFVLDLVGKAKAGMAIARQLTVRELQCCGARQEAAAEGRYLVDSGGVLYATVKVDWSLSGVPLASSVQEVLYRLGINDREPNVSAIEIHPDHAELVLSRLYEVDMDAFPRDLGVPMPFDHTYCMM